MLHQFLQHCIRVILDSWCGDLLFPCNKMVHFTKRNTWGWGRAPFVFVAMWRGTSKVAQAREYTITSLSGARNPRFLTDNVEHTKSSTHMSVHTPTTNICNHHNHGLYQFIISNYWLNKLHTRVLICFATENKFEAAM